MTAPDEDLTRRVTDEIRSLRKGRSLQVGDLDARLGPLLLELAGNGDAADRRAALTAAISRCTAQLAGEYRVGRRGQTGGVGSFGQGVHPNSIGNSLELSVFADGTGDHGQRHQGVR